jgi:alpha-D-xyloside xylohydrolase
MSLPLLVRPNTVLPMGSHSDRPDYDYSDNVVLKIFQLEDGKQVRVDIPDTDGNIETVFDIAREKDVVRIQRQGSSKNWNVLLVNVHDVESNSSSEQTPEGRLFILVNTTDSLQIKLLEK